MISRKARTKLLLLGAAISLSSIFQMGYCNAYPNTAIDKFRAYLNKSMTHRGGTFTETTYVWLWSGFLNIWFAGFAIGTWIAVFVTDSLGRKRGLLMGNFLNIISVVVMTLGITFGVFEMLFVGRFFSAISAGISMCALILFLQEISPVDMRGTMSFYAELSFVVMNAVGAVMGMTIVLGNHLAYLVGFALIPGIISVLLLLPLHETPRFLFLKKHDETKAISSFKFYLDLDEENIRELLAKLAEEFVDKSSGGSIRELMATPHLRTGLLLGILALQVTTSIWPVIYLSTEFLRRANISYDLAEYVSSIMLIFSTMATLFGMVLVEKFSRRNLFILVSATNVIAILLFATFAQLQKVADLLKYGCVLAICMHGITYSLATGPIAWFITAELIPLQYRSLSQTIALSLNQIAALIFCFVTLPLYNLIDSYALILLFVLPGSLCLLYLYWNLPETKGRDIHEIIEDLKGNRLDVKYEMAPTTEFKE